jgi:hypothetical protein
MRHRKQTIQVNTFPFLAVLLCAMGSLILLMLVLDRRARVVAKAKAQRAAELAKADNQNDVALRQAEWERRRQLLHTQLSEQDQSLVAQVQEIRRQIESTAGSAIAEQGKARALLKEIEGQKSRLARLREVLGEQQDATVEKARQTQVSESELARLTDELLQTERTLAELKEFRKRQQQMYSLVPYRGKRGDNRRPIYIECAANGVVFHPGRLAFEGPKFIPADVRAEIERKTSHYRTTLTAATDGSDDSVYVLMLIRPDGITTYYKTLTAIGGMRLDFGYEFIDRDWVLDFPESNDAPARRPWIQANGAVSLPPPSPGAKKVAGLRAFVPGSSNYQERTTAAGQSDGHGPNGGSPYPRRDSRASTDRGPMGQFPASPGSTSSDSGVPGSALPGSSAGIPASGRDGALSVAPTGMMRGPSTDRGLVAPPAAGSWSGGSQPNALPGFRSVDGGNSFRPSDPGPNSGDRGSVAIGTPQGVYSPSSVPGSPSATTELGSAEAQTSAGTAAGHQPDAAGQRAPDPARGNPGSAEQQAISPSTLPEFPIPTTALLPAPVGAPAINTTGQSNAATPRTGEPGSGSRRNAETDEGNRSGFAIGLPHDSLSELVPRDLKKKPSRPLPFTGLLNGNRDWIISLECKADSVVILPSRQRILTAQFAGSQNGANPLRESVEQMIVRRQTSLREGEMPYRPMVRFRVWPDGVRTYYLAYPALEGLRVPMTREDVPVDRNKEQRLQE